MTIEERSSCRRIESSLLYFEKQPPKILQGGTLEGSKLSTNSFPIEELGFEPLLTIPEMELIIMKDENGEGALATKDEGSKHRSSIFLMSLAGL